jgi:predicted RNA binding protein YcfA (HicA-like mRNA interferase family)
MPRKIRELEADLARAGFTRQSGKGSHRKWAHPSGAKVTMSGLPGDDAKRYQEDLVRDAIERARRGALSPCKPEA